MSNLPETRLSNQCDEPSKTAINGVDMAGAEVHKQPNAISDKGCLTMEKSLAVRESAEVALSNPVADLRHAAGLAITALSFEIERAFERRDTAACLQMKEAKDALIEALKA